MVTLNIIHGDAISKLKAMPDNSVESIVTDPPYELGNGATSKGWDSTGIAYSVELWKEALRVLKPGGALLCFGSARTYFAVAHSIDAAGFNIQQSIAWLYNIGQDRNPDMGYRVEVEGVKKGEATPMLRFSKWLRETAETHNLTAKDYRAEVAVNNMWSHYAGKGQPAIPPASRWEEIKSNMLTPRGIEVPAWVDEIVENSGDFKTKRLARLASREVVWTKKVGKFGSGSNGGAEHIDAVKEYTEYSKTSAVTEEGKKWESWRESLSPAFEPIIVARKPFATFAELSANAKEVPGYGNTMRISTAMNLVEFGTGAFNDKAAQDPEGRKTKNVIIAEELEEYVSERTGQAPGFFYSPKPKKAERPVSASGVMHSTVKPLALMRYLVALVTPPGGTVLDIFAGSGTTLEAAALEGFSSVGIEMDEEHVELCEVRKGRVAELLDPESPKMESKRSA